jgi:beta-galactosidase
MGRVVKITAWLVGIPLGIIIVAVMAWPLYAPSMIDHKYQSFSDVYPKVPETYSAQVKGAQPEIACGGTAGQYNWGETARQYVSLNGSWAVEQGDLSDTSPTHFTHTTPVPGLLTSAQPQFSELGVSSEQRDAFWFKRNFEAPSVSTDTALLCIAKIKYGARVWLNGKPLGEHYGAFTQAEFNLADAIRWGQDNELIVRVGADRSQVPAFIPVGQDNEKEQWIPGIWDDVNLLFTGAQTVVRTKVETDIDSGMATVKTTLRNNTAVEVALEVSQSLREWKSNQLASSINNLQVILAAGETKTVEQKVAVNNMQLWTLDNPFLYVADSVVFHGGKSIDDRSTRFGFRSVEWRGGKDKGFYLNGKLTYLRGSNFSLGRFFEDADAGNLAWDEQWVRKLYTSYPRDYHWNTFRTSIGRLPNFWYDIADEEGFLIDDEFAFWALPFPPKTEGKENPKENLQWSMVELEKEFTS